MPHSHRHQKEFERVFSCCWLCWSFKMGPSFNLLKPWKEVKRHGSHGTLKKHIEAKFHRDYSTTEKYSFWTSHLSVLILLRWMKFARSSLLFSMATTFILSSSSPFVTWMSHCVMFVSNRRYDYLLSDHHSSSHICQRLSTCSLSDDQKHIRNKPIFIASLQMVFHGKSVLFARCCFVTPIV